MLDCKLCIRNVLDFWSTQGRISHQIWPNTTVSYVDLNLRLGQIDKNRKYI